MSVVAFRTAEQIEAEYNRRLRAFVAAPSQVAADDVMALFHQWWRAVTGSTDGENETRADLCRRMAFFLAKARAA